MKTRAFQTPKTHTVVKRECPNIAVYYYCTTCNRVVEERDINKRCKGAK